MKGATLILFLAAASCCSAGIFDNSPAVGPAYKVHGRISIYCGTPSCRLWIVGTKRILGIAESDPPETPVMPARLHALLTTQNLLFGDFTVVPLTKDEPGVMRIVRIVAAENVVATDSDLNFIRRVPGKFEGAPNHSPEPTLTSVTPAADAPAAPAARAVH